MKIVINRCYGGFGLSKEAYDFLGIKCEERWGNWFPKDFVEVKRNDPKLVECVETLKEKANGNSAKLRVVEIPDDVNWYIDEYDGIETVEEQHRSWC